MASGPEHYAKAEDFLYAYKVNGEAMALEKAKIHATLALVAATAWNRPVQSTPHVDWAVVAQSAT